MFDYKSRIEALVRLLDRIEQGMCPWGVNVSLDCPPIVELSAKMGAEWLIFDLEHTLLDDRSSIASMARAADIARVPYFAKLNSWDPSVARDAMDAGAFGIVIPFVETVEQIEEAYRALRFPPHGDRGYCSVARSLGYGSYRYSPTRDEELAGYFEFANQHALVIPTIETKAALENIDSLLAAPNAPLIHIGLDDLALRLSEDGSRDMAAAYRISIDLGEKIVDAGKHVLSWLSLDHQVERDENVEDMVLRRVAAPYVADTQTVCMALAETSQIVELGRGLFKKL